MIYLLTSKLAFPDPRNGEPDGLFAVGGDLSPERLLLAYCNGIFPWYSFAEGTIEWWCPMDRFVIFPDEIHISHSMRTLLNKGRYYVTINRAFDRVIRCCGEVNGRSKMEGAWLGPDIIAAYTELHRRGFCASVEVWEAHPSLPSAEGSGEGRLVGGLYGVTIGHSFIGESMFSLVPSGSKIALIGLAQFLAQHGGRMIDCQFETPHLKSMGGRHIPYDEYLEILQDGLPIKPQ